MGKLYSIVSAALVSVSVLANASASLGQVQTTDQRNCLNHLNKAGVNVAKQQGKENANCIKLAGNSDLMITAQACLTADIKGRIQKKKDKTIAEETKWCTTLPNFGYTNSSTINQYAPQAELDLLADIFGANLDPAIINCDVSKKGCLCQQKVTKAVDKVAAKKWGEFLKCKKAVVKAGATTNAALEDCVDDPGTEGSIAADTKDMISKAVANLNKKIAEECDAEGVTTGAFPGDCNALMGAALTTCLDTLAECRICQMINDIDATFVNCDLFDDGMPNASCASGAGPTPTITHTPTQTMTPTQTRTPTITPTVDPSAIFRGALVQTSGVFNYGGMPSVPGATNECNIRYPGSHACTKNELLAAETAGNLVGATDYNSALVNSFWIIDPMAPLAQQCHDNMSMLVWDYGTIHTGVQGLAASLTNGSGDLGTPTITGCGSFIWVGCCQ